MSGSRQSRQDPTGNLLAVTICFALLLSTLAIGGPRPSAAAAKPQEQARAPQPESGPPAGNLPNLDAVRRLTPREPKPPAEIPSLMRHRRKPIEPRNGRKVGDPGTTGSSAGTTRDAGTSSLVTAGGPARFSNDSSRGPKVAPDPMTASTASRLAKRRTNAMRHHALGKSAFSPSGIIESQYVQNFFVAAMARQPNTAEQSYWNDILRAAYAHAPTSMVMAVREMGKTLFESSEYAARNRSNHDYVYDLYESYLLRYPDSGGWSYWESQVPLLGREDVRRAFDESGEFASDVSTVTLTGTASSGVSSLLTARVDANNQSGNQIMARDAEWSLPLIGLPGRAGLDLGLGLSYSSAATWTRSGPYIYFDEDNSALSPGFRLGFPTVQELFFNAQTGQNAYLLITSAGSRVELRQVGTTNVYEAADSSYLQLTDNGSSLLVRGTDGTQLSYVKIENEWHCTQVKDRNGNYITASYNSLGDLTSVVDTMNRPINFNYDGNANLSSITQQWTVNSQSVTHTWATFGWGTATIQPNFSGIALAGIANSQSIPVLTMVGLADGSYYKFAYSSWNSGEVALVKHCASDSNPATDSHVRSSTTFNYLAADDSARLVDTRISAENWTGINGVPSEVITQFAVNGDGSHQVAVTGDPNSVVHKEYYGSGWQHCLVTRTEDWAGGVEQKWTTTTWTRDNTNVTYFTNPRVTDSYIYDAVGNIRRTHIDYTASFGLPFVIYEYQADAVTVYRITVNNYNLSATYTNRRIIGLRGNTWVFDGSWNAYSVVTFDYDAAADLQALPNGANAVQHDYTNYGVGLVSGRGNLSSVTRWDATDPNNSSKAVTSEVGYNVTGSVIFQKDPLGHQDSTSYGDAFSDGNNARNTFAYPTTATNADGFQSSAQYNFDFGAGTRMQGPPPAGQAQGIIRTFTYDNAARLLQATTANNSAYTRYFYGSYYVQSWTSINNVGDYYSIRTFDGVGRVIGAASDNPGSSGTYKAQMTKYDLMGRMLKQSNPAEINVGWVPWGDDVAGFLYTQQTYDFKGRPLVTTNPDTTTKTASYSGCGCAGGEVVTLTDEGTVSSSTPKQRQQRIYHDVFGRVSETKLLNWDGAGTNGTGGTVYSATMNTYNVLDQVSQVRQYNGDDNVSTYQDTLTTYDGSGRLKTQHRPEQSLNGVPTYTTYNYNPDDTVASVIDGRGATCSYGYNNRHQVTSLTHALSGSATIVISNGYDAAGNRTSMSHTVGGAAKDSASYGYDQLSRLTSETRHINALEPYTNQGNYTINYGYTLSGELQSVTDPFNATINYNYDTAGRTTSVGGTSYAGVTSYASNVLYRAWGGVKSASFADNTSETITYNARLQPTQFRLNSSDTWKQMHDDYNYYADGRLKQFHDLDDTTAVQGQWHYMSRSYSYDQAARIAGVSAYDPATSNTQPPPFGASYGYDPVNNMTSRGGAYGVHSWQTDGSTYTNNRRGGWTYDGDGRVLGSADASTSSSRTWSYDAAGEETGVSETAGTATSTDTMAYDGDRQMLYESVTKPGYSSSDYLIHATALGGAVLTKLNSTGSKNITYVPANGLVAPMQTDNSGSPYVNWVHRDPLGVQEGATGAYDPLGNLVYNEQPPTSGPPPTGPFYGPGYSGAGWGTFSNANNLSSGCIEDGLPKDCNKVKQDFNNGLTNIGESLPWTDNSKRMPTAPVGYVEFSEGETKQSMFILGDPLSDPEKPRAPFVDTDVLNGCTKDYFGWELINFKPSARGEFGSFKGKGPSYLWTNSVAGNHQELTITNNTTEYSGAYLKQHYNEGASGSGVRPIAVDLWGLTDRGAPQTNYTAFDVPTAMDILVTQVHELGHSLDAIAQIGWDDPDKHQGKSDLGGQILEDCVRTRGGFKYK